MNMSLIITEGNYGAIDYDYYSFCGYYIIKCYSLSYTLQAYFIIDGQVISSGEMVCERTFLNYQYKLSLLCFKKKSTQLYL